MNPRSWIGACVFVLATTTVSAQQPAAIGRIKIASGSVLIVRASGLLPAQAGQDVFEADGLRTGPDGRVGITLKDDTRVSLGPSSEVRLDRFGMRPPTASLDLCSRSSAALRHMCRDGSPSSRPIPSVLKHPKPLSAFAEPRSPSASYRNERRATGRHSECDPRRRPGVGLRATACSNA